MSYKFYNSLYCSIYDGDTNKARLLRFKDVIVDNFYFIKALIYYRDSLIGSVSEYANGSSCDRLWLHRSNLDKLINALAILKKNVYELSKLGIYIEDQDLSNILYDGSVFSIIYAGDYYVCSDIMISEKEIIIDDVDTIYRKNMEKLISLLFKSITDFDNMHDNFIFAFLNEIDSLYKDYLVDTEMMVNPDETIIGIRDTIQEAIGRQIRSFSNSRSDLRRILKNR